MILFWMFYRKVSSKYHKSIIEHGNKSIIVTATQHPHWSLRANPLNPKSRANPLISQITIIGKDNKNVTKWASSVPTWGKHVTQPGQAPCPCWARVIHKTCPKHFKTYPDLSKGKEHITQDIATRPKLTSSPSAPPNHYSPHLASPAGKPSRQLPDGFCAIE